MDKIRILVLDDDSNESQTLIRVLEGEGYATDRAKDPLDASNFFNEKKWKWVVEPGAEFQRVHSQNLTLKRQLKQKYKFENIIGDHPQMQRVFRIIEKISDTDSTVLISGE